MPNLMLYATRDDAELIRDWINADPNVAWITKDSQDGNVYRWRAVRELAKLRQQQYAIWHILSDPLTVPSGMHGVPDTAIANPFEGWVQELGSPSYTAPWFGGNLPGPYFFRYAEEGREAPGSIARSEFSWPGNRYRAIGKPAHPEAERWWNRLRHFLTKHSTRVHFIPDPGPSKGRNPFAFVFPEAWDQVSAGRPRDINPSAPRDT